MENNGENNGLIVLSCDVRNLKSVGEELLDSVFSLKEKGNFNSCHILISIGFELLLKSLIAAKLTLDNKNKSEEDILRIINDELKKLGHQFDKIFDAVNKFSSIKENLQISKIEKFRNEFICEYRLLNNNNKLIMYIKDFESIRYQSLSSSKNVLVQRLTDKEIDFIKKFKEECQKIYEFYEKQIRNFKNFN